MSSTINHQFREELKILIYELVPEIRSLRRYLHQHPEPSNEEFRTTLKIAEVLRNSDIECEIAPTGRGLIVNSRYQGGARRIALRADMDALRIQDEKDVDYRSTEPNLMHACGHDAHTAMLVGTVIALSEFDRRYPETLTWRAIFQPAEEIASGALEMISWGAMENVDSVIALHVDPSVPMGEIRSKPGPISAICEEFQFTIHGRGGHGARPQSTIDPIAAGVELVSRLYNEVPRQVNEPEQSVISIGTFNAGTSSNVIPETAELKGTLRTVSEESSRQIKERIQIIAAEIEQTSGAVIEFKQNYHLPCVANDSTVFSAWWNLAYEMLGDDNVTQMEQPSMGGEDFAYYLKHVPGCMFRLGVGSDDGSSPVLHSPHFDINEDSLVIGSQLLAAYVLSCSTN